MNHEFFLLTANSGEPNFLIVVLGIASCLVFLCFGFLIGWRLWHPCKSELERLDVENRKLTNACKVGEKHFIKQQEKMARLP